MEKNKVTTYLLYAIGEIVLVVIGILIAVSLNNWNNEKNARAREMVILNNLNEEFSANLKDLETNTLRLDSLTFSLQRMLEVMHQGPQDLSVPEFEILLEKTFFTPYWASSSVVLDELKNSGGFSQLSDLKLRDMLFEWELNLSRLSEMKSGYDEYAVQYIYYLTDHGSVRNLDAIGGTIEGLQKSSIAQNELSLLRDPKFENRVDNFYFLAKGLLRNYRQTAERMKVIIEQTNINE